MSVFPAIEEKLDAAFDQWAPELPDKSKRALIQYLPWLSLVLGLLTLYTAYVVWHWAHVATQLTTYANNLSALYGGPQITSNRVTLGIWLSIAVLAIETALYIVAFPATRVRKRTGWDLIVYALLLNVVYGAVIMFTAYGDFGNFVGTIVGTSVGLYLLFQVRDTYAAKTIEAVKPRATKSTRRKVAP